MRRAVGTPCPGGSKSFLFNDDTIDEGLTTDLEYTTAFKATFRNVKPRRPVAARQTTVEFAIHEDVEVTDNREVARPKRAANQFAKPAIRAQNVLGKRQSIRHFDASVAGSLSASTIESEVQQLVQPDVTKVKEPGQKCRKEAEKKDARRKTLYVPPDDTTQPTMWMGVFSPVKSAVQGQTMDSTCELTGIAARMAEKIPRQRASVHARPIRIALQPNMTAQAQAVPDIDRAGAPTGKENVPPHKTSTRTLQSSNRHDPEPVKPIVDRDLQRREFLANARQRSGRERQSEAVSTMYEIGTKQSSSTPKKTRTSRWSIADSSTPRTKVPASPRYTLTQSPKPVLQTKQIPQVLPTTPTNKTAKLSSSRYQQLQVSELIDKPELDEEQRLIHEEAVLKEILNDLFTRLQVCNLEGPDGELQHTLFEFYNSIQTVVMKQKLTDALQYGALSLTQESMFLVQGLCKDVGRKQQYLDFWVDTFNHTLLRTSLEVLTGKQIRDWSQTDTRRSLSRFIEAFLLRHEDGHFKAAGTGMVHDLGTKTILKSLMLLKALDTCKEENLSRTLLFKSTSSYKTTRAALNALVRLLMPTNGDGVRHLRHLGYEVRHEQEQLLEISYQITNLAVDLRDGVILTRLVELLLCERSSSVTNIRLKVASQPFPISQGLNLCSTSRVVKLQNVQLALTSLAEVESLQDVVQDTRPEDIVDGHREKTVRLLWGILSRFGLATVVGATPLSCELDRFKHKNHSIIKRPQIAAQDTASLACQQLLGE